MLGRFKGNELLGIQYKPLFELTNKNFAGKTWSVLSADYVTVDDGSGIVHIAPAFGAEDYLVGVQNDLPVLNPVTSSGYFDESLELVAGKWFKDADKEAIERGALRCFRNSGQSCNAPTRMLVEKSMYNEAIQRLKKYTENFEVGDPQKEGEHIGPVISETQYNKIQTLIKKGIDEGAKLIAGGPGKPKGLEKGYFVKPTVFADVNNTMDIARTEIFGPVLSVIPFENEDEAIRIANDTPYGLTNYIQTQDPEKVKRVSRRVRSGMVDVNGAGIAVDAPFGGFKHSGIGREAGQHGLDEFLEVKAVGGWSN